MIERLVNDVNSIGMTRKRLLGFALLLTFAACSSNEPQGPSPKSSALFAMGLSTFNTGNYPKSLELFKKALLEAPEEKNYQMHIALVYLQMEQYKKSEIWFKQACTGETGFAQCWNNFSNLYIKMKNAPKAMEMAKKALSVDTYTSPDLAWANIAQAYELQGKYASANKAVDKAIRLESERCNLRLLKARIELRQNNLVEALANSRRALLSCPRNSTAHHWDAYLHLKQGLRNAAIERYNGILQSFRTGDAVHRAQTALDMIEKRLPVAEPPL